jgi:hypothetical protein
MDGRKNPRNFHGVKNSANFVVRRGSNLLMFCCCFVVVVGGWWLVVGGGGGGGSERSAQLTLGTHQGW